MRLAIQTALLISALLWAPSAFAQDANEFYEAGLEAFNQGKYEPSIENFEEAYRLQPKPILLYNIAVAYGRLGKLDEALEHGTLVGLQGLPSPELEKNQARLIAWRTVQNSQGWFVEPPEEREIILPPLAERRTKKPWLIASIVTLGLAAGAGVGWAVLELGLQEHADAFDSANASGNSIEAQRILSDEIEPRQGPARALSVSTAVLSVAGLGLLIYALIPYEENRTATFNGNGFSFAF